MILSRPAQLRTLAQEDRLAILRLLSRGKATGAQIAAQLGLPASRVHYHLNELAGQSLVREVARGRKRWKEERYFEAVAHHFLVDPAIGIADAEATGHLARAAELAFSGWRRRQILNLDLGQMARKIVVDCLRARNGERVMLMFQPPALEIAEAVLVELEAAGARPLLKLWSRNILLRTLDRHAPESLAQIPFLDRDDDAALDAVLYLSTSVPQGAPPSPEQMAKLPHRLAAVSTWQRSIRERGVRYIEVSIPHRAALEACDWTSEQSMDAYWRSLDADYACLRERALSLMRRLEGQSGGTGTADLLLRDSRGTSLDVRVDLSHPLVSDGALSEEDLREGRAYEELPAGSVAYLPLDGSGDGTYVADYAWLAGRTVARVRVEIRAGRIATIESAREEETAFLRERLATASGDANRLAHVRVGVNENATAVPGLSGWPPLDSCLDGVTTLGFGNNELLGGEVRSTIDLALPSRSARLS